MRELDIQIVDAQPKAFLLEELFMPIDWRRTVTADYIPYQLFDSLQAIASSVCGLLASREALVTAGVARSDASVDRALMLNIASEAASRLLSIWFSWRYAAHFDADCKRFRFLADIFNDSAMILSTLSSAVPSSLQSPIVIAAACLRALCGVCAGSTKAALTNHFALSEASVGDVNAKDGSQETLIYLIGLALGSLVVPLVQTRGAIWTSLLSLIALHLYMNWRACRSVELRSLNPQRLKILMKAFYKDGVILTPREVARKEAVLGTGLRPWAYMATGNMKPLTERSLCVDGKLIMMAEGYALRHLLEALFALHGAQHERTRPGGHVQPEMTALEGKGWSLAHDCLGYDGLLFKKTT
jgi:hypothetical protein